MSFLIDRIGLLMSKSNGIALSFVLFLISTSSISHVSVAFGSPDSPHGFNRPDPLQHFKAYRGGYDIRNKHYWASAAFTGIHGYAIAGICVLFGLGFGSYVIIKYLNGGSSAVAGHPASHYIMMFSLIVLFTIFAIVAAGLVMAANQTTFNRARKLRGTILEAGDDVEQTIQNLTQAFVDMQTRLQPYDSAAFNLLNSTDYQLQKESKEIKSFVQGARHSSNEGLQTLHVANLVIVIVNLVLLLAALVLLSLHWQRVFIIIIFLGWILTSLAWVLTGIDFYFQTFVRDTCAAFQEFSQNPQTSSMKTMLPCIDSSKAESMLVNIGSTVHSFIGQLNSKLALIEQAIGLAQQNDGSFGRVCDPFSSDPEYSYNPENCTKDAVPISQVLNLLSRLTCQDKNSTEQCLSEGKFIPERSYLMATAYSRSVEDLLNVFPLLQSLTFCTSVKAAFSDVELHQCKPLKFSVHMLWASVLSLSIIMMILLLLWVAKAFQDRGRCFSKFSIIPNTN